MGRLAVSVSSAVELKSRGRDAKTGQFSLYLFRPAEPSVHGFEGMLSPVVGVQFITAVTYLVAVDAHIEAIGYWCDSDLR